jgi:hypothetical protein
VRSLPARFRLTQLRDGQSRIFAAKTARIALAVMHRHENYQRVAAAHPQEPTGEE